MSNIATSYLKEKLKLFLGEAEIEEVFNKVIASSGLAKKDSYSDEEIEKLLKSMMVEGGFVEFVARNVKAGLLLGK